MNAELKEKILTACGLARSDIRYYLKHEERFTIYEATTNDFDFKEFLAGETDPEEIEELKKVYFEILNGTYKSPYYSYTTVENTKYIIARAN